MALPNSRNTTYVANAKVLANDLNALQDAIIGYKHPSLTVAFGSGYVRGAGIAHVGFYDGSDWNTASFFWRVDGVGHTQGEALAGISLPVGTRITAWGVRIDPTSAAVCPMDFLRTDETSVTVIDSVNSDGTANLQTVTGTIPLSGHIVLADNRYWIKADADANTMEFEFLHAFVTFDRL